ncbi:MAG: A/G-specific adenine glycosylase [Deltaproteobacteria bacterium]|nr:A/G-specific adenine glycosylase [Deltaproteobacteria bacterium]
MGRSEGKIQGACENAIAKAVLSWFDPAARPMAWREKRDPYRIWISEVMLQQTTVAAVAPYYRRFLDAFPSVESLARASLDNVLKAWEGLGYYARARNLHAAARILVADRGGRLPETVEELVTLPGIGRSTAGAIAAIAFGRDAPVLDSNVKRVVARLFGIEEDLARADVQRTLWDLSGRLVLPGRGRETALAFMDLGGLVCTPRKPDCPACPAKRHCRARRSGKEEAIPFKPARAKRPRFVVAIPIIEDGRGRVLIGRRTDDDLLGGLWAFPGGKARDGETLEGAAHRIAVEKTGLSVEVFGPIGSVDHGYSHYAVTLHGYRCRRRNGRLRPKGAWRWTRPERLRDYPFVLSNRKLAALL